MKLDKTFICNKCGEITYLTKQEEFNMIHKTILCSCGEKIAMSNSYPNLDAVDLKFSAEQIYEIADKQDIENKSNFIKILKKQKIQFDDNKIELIVNLYEKNKENFKDNIPNQFNPMYDALEKELMVNNFTIVEIDAIISSLAVSMKNKMRKPFIVITASVIEMLFNDFFDKLIEYKFNGDGIEIIKKQYSKASISKCIVIADGFSNGKLKEKINDICDGFMENWQELITKRNKIVHNNKIYITKEMMIKTLNLLNNSINVFAKLKSTILANTYDK